MRRRKLEKTNHRSVLGIGLNGPTIWLAYFAWYFTLWIFEPPNSRELVASAIAIALFLVIYYDAFYKTGRRAWFGIIAITFISLGMSFYTASASIFFIYAVMIAIQSQRGKKRIYWFVGILAIVVLPAIPGYVPVVYAAGCLLFGPLVAVSTLTTSTLEDQTAELLETRAEVRNIAIIAERERIGRDLHDALGHILTVITIKSDLATRLSEVDQVGAAREMAAVNKAGRDALKQIREVVAGMESATISGELSQARYLLETADITLETLNAFSILEASKVLPVLDVAYEHALGMIIREATTNVVKHAEATRCKVSLKPSGGNIILSISDDGNGREIRRGRGLASMEDRTKSLGGRLTVSTTEGLGTLLRFTFPLSRLPGP